jgi:hypothetical protein
MDRRGIEMLLRSLLRRQIRRLPAQTLPPKESS